MRAALNELATEAPIWLQSVVPAQWYQRYGRRVEDDRLPQSKAGCEGEHQKTGANFWGNNGDYFKIREFLLRLL